MTIELDPTDPTIAEYPPTRSANPPGPKSPGPKSPSLRVEKALLRDGAECIIGIDEVGRGALAGPVAVGATILKMPAPRIPAGLRDSKLLTPLAREALHVPVQRWVAGYAVGLSSAAEIDEFGIIAALGFAARRALERLVEHPMWVGEPVIVLDGSHDWLTRVLPAPATVRARVKADRDVAIVSAASVLAKVHRDRMMVELHDDHPAYGWSSNKGYAAPEHWAGLDEHGPGPLHRHTWLTRWGSGQQPLFALE